MLFQLGQRRLGDPGVREEYIVPLLRVTHQIVNAGQGLVANARSKQNMRKLRSGSTAALLLCHPAHSALGCLAKQFLPSDETAFSSAFDRFRNFGHRDGGVR